MTNAETFSYAHAQARDECCKALQHCLIRQPGARPACVLSLLLCVSLLLPSLLEVRPWKPLVGGAAAAVCESRLESLSEELEAADPKRLQFCDWLAGHLYLYCH